MKTYTISTAEKNFEKIKSGKKIIESRLFYDERKKFKIGDCLELVNEGDKNEKLLLKIKELIIKDSFEELFKSKAIKDFGYETIGDALKNVFLYYTKENEKKFGVIGIIVERIK
ncbi:MAG: hypothetical protein RI945_269 [Candidatus Parcubacteria bacterium]